MVELVNPNPNPPAQITNPNTDLKGQSCCQGPKNRNWLILPKTVAGHVYQTLALNHSYSYVVALTLALTLSTL